MILVEKFEKVIGLKKTAGSCAIFDIFLENNYMIQCFLICPNGKIWWWRNKDEMSQSFYTKMEALEAMKNNKITWEII